MTKKQKSALRKEMLEVANGYEVKQRIRLRNVRFTADSARWSGQAHDYTVHLSQLDK